MYERRSGKRIQRWRKINGKRGSEVEKINWGSEVEKINRERKRGREGKEREYGSTVEKGRERMKGKEKSQVY